MRFEKVVPTSNYYYYMGGERIDDPAAMAHFRNKGIVQYYTGYHETEYWSEPDCAEFDRIDFPDKTHCRMLWARGGEDAFDVSREDGMMKLTSNVWQESSFIMYLPEMMRYAAPRCSPSTGYLYSLCYWGRFTSNAVLKCFGRKSAGRLSTPSSICCAQICLPSFPMLLPRRRSE